MLNEEYHFPTVCGSMVRTSVEKENTTLEKKVMVKKSFS